MLMEWIKDILPYVGTLLGGGAITHLFNRRAYKNKALAESDSAQAEAKAKEIDNEKSAIEIYRKLIEDIEEHLGRRIQALEEEMKVLKEIVNNLKGERNTLRKENKRLKQTLDIAKQCPNPDCPIKEKLNG